MSVFHNILSFFFYNQAFYIKQQLKCLKLNNRKSIFITHLFSPLKIKKFYTTLISAVNIAFIKKLLISIIYTIVPNKFTRF